MSAATGKSFVYRDVPGDEYRAMMAEQGEEDWYITLVLELYDRIAGDVLAATHDGVQRALGREPTSFASFCRDHAEALAHQV